MLYIKSLTINKFKSFNHAELLLGKGFTCVIGPNGSGKSTICDALLFGLGENSTKRLRIGRYDDLIRAYKDNNERLRTAYVRMEFGGDEDLSITRFTRSDGKTMYKVNGKHHKRFEVLEMLAKHGIFADETNTIIQGEISSLGQMNPAQLRELIDITAGIREFEFKKGEALKELEKVNQKIGEGKIMLSERSGFLTALAAEKEGAEKYMQMSARLKALNYSILFEKKNAAEHTLSEFTTSLAIADGKEKAASQKLQAVSATVDKLSAERHGLTEQLSKSSDSMGSTKARLEGISIQIAKIDAEVAAGATAIAESRKQIVSMDEESRQKKGGIDANALRIAETVKSLGPLEQAIKNAKVKPEDFKSGPERMKSLNAEVQRLEGESAAVAAELSKANADLSILANSAASKSAELDRVKEALGRKELESEELEKLYGVSTRKHKELGQKSAALAKELESMNARVGKMDEELIALMEQRAYLQPKSQALAEKLKAKFGSEDGFFGKASDLCAYGAEHALAVEAAAGSRFEYLVTDTIDTANRIIGHMKESGLGRATFIPIKELREQRESAPAKDATPLLDMVKFDDKFEKVFSYVFSNTYLIDSISNARQYGIGKARYVTLEGDIVEQSGVVSGGSATKRQSLSLINSRTQALNTEKAELKAKLASMRSALEEAQKGVAYAEMDAAASKSKLNVAAVDAASARKAIAEITTSMVGLSKKESELKARLAEREKRSSAVGRELEECKAKLNAVVNETVEITRRMSEGGVTHAEIEALEKKRADAQALKISKAELEKENKMLTARLAELKAQIQERTGSIKAGEKEAARKEGEKSALAVSRGEIERKIANSNEESKRVFAQLGMLDSEIGKAGTEKGRLTAELNTHERQVGEIRIRRAQIEVTLKDLTAELSLYKDPAVLVAASIPEMEKESIVLNAKIRDLGNVNLKAPEIYAQRAKDVEEARGKVETLETEKQAIHRMLEEIESKKLQTFMSTFNDVAVNFQKFSMNFFTEKPTIALSNMRDPFSGGLDIMIKEGKANKHLTSLSGGEKALVLLILVFSIYMCRPSSIYIFDEVDAALDRENSKKLSLLIKQMSAGGQFIVVSHNDSLLTNADVAIGVVKTEGESKAVGLEVSGMLSSAK